MFSAETLLSINGDSYWGDYLETLAFNALPAAFTPDMWAHQYDQQPNQIECSRQSDSDVPFNSNNGEAHLFGLEPHYGCCTANHGQAFPKFALSAVRKSADGFAVLSPVPIEIDDEFNGIATRIKIVSEYPFRDCFYIEISCEKPNSFTLKLRIPSFVEKAYIDGTEYAAGTYAEIKDTFEYSKFKITFVCIPRLKKTKNEMYILRRGALFYALPLAYRQNKLEYIRDTSAWASYNICTVNPVERKFPYCDYEFFTESKWNYAFVSERFEYQEFFLEYTPFNPERPPCAVLCQMAEISWRKEHGMCKDFPENLISSKKESLALIPYGATILRMAEMPMIKTVASHNIIKNK